MGLCFSKDVPGERDNSYVTPEMVSPQYYYSGIIRLSSFRSGPGTPPGVTLLLDSPRMSSMALDSPRHSVSVSSRDFVISPRLSADVGDTGTLNALFNRTRWGGRQGIRAKYYQQPQQLGGGGAGAGVLGAPGVDGGGGRELQVVSRTDVYSEELSSSQRLATQKILQCQDKESRRHCICCTDCGSKKIAKCRDCGSDKLAICPMCDNRIPRCGECRFGKPLSCGACGSARLSSSLQIEAGKINCGCCGAIMLASCDRCATRFKRPTCGQCGRPSTDVDSRDELEEFSEFGLDQSGEGDSSVEFLELTTGVVEIRRRSPHRHHRTKQQRQQLHGPFTADDANLPARSSTEGDIDVEDSTLGGGGDTSFDTASGGDSDQDNVVTQQEASTSGKDYPDSETASASSTAIHTRNISFGKYVPEVPPQAAAPDAGGNTSGRHPPHLLQILFGDVSFSSYLAGPASAAQTDGNEGLDDLVLHEFGQQFESVAKSYAEAAAMAAARDAFVFREENDASLTFPKLFESEPITENIEQWSVPFLSLETDSVLGSADQAGKTLRSGGTTDQTPSLPGSAVQTKKPGLGMGAGEGNARIGHTVDNCNRNDEGQFQEGGQPILQGAQSPIPDAGLAGSPDDDRRSKIMDRMEERFIRAQLHTHGFLLDSLSKEEFTDQLRLRHAALRRQASENGAINGAGAGAMAGLGGNIARNLQRKSAEYTRSTGKEQEIEEVEVEVVRSQDLRKGKGKGKGKEKGGLFSAVSEGIFHKKQAGKSKGAALTEQVPVDLEERVLFIERAFNKRKEKSHSWEESVRERAPQNHINMSEFIEALKASSSSDRPGKYSLANGSEPQMLSPLKDGSRKGKAVSWGYVVREPRSKSFEETRVRYPILEDTDVPRRRHSLESNRNATVRDSDLKSCLKTTSSVPPDPSFPPESTRYPLSSRPGRVPLTFSSEPFMPQGEVSKAVPEKKWDSKSSESFKYESLAAFSMVHDYDSDVSAHSKGVPHVEQRPSRSRVSSSVMLDCGGQLSRSSCRGMNSVETRDQVFGGSDAPNGATSGSRKAGFGDHSSAVRVSEGEGSVQDMCDVLSLPGMAFSERSSPNHQSSRSQGSESRKASSLRRSSSGSKMSAMGMESSPTTFMSLRNLGALEEEIENFLGASPSHNKSIRKAEVQRKVNQIAGLAHLTKQQRAEEGKHSQWSPGAEPCANLLLDAVEEDAMAYIMQSRKAAMAGATSYTNVGSPASSMDEEVEKFVIGGSDGRSEDSGAGLRTGYPANKASREQVVSLEEDPGSNTRNVSVQTVDGLPHWLGATDYGSAFGSPLDPVAPVRNAQIYHSTASDVFGSEPALKRSYGDRTAFEQRRNFQGTIAYGLPAFLPSDLETKGAADGGVGSFPGRYTVSVVNATGRCQADADFSGAKDGKEGEWDMDGDSDSSSDLFEIETDSSAQSKRIPNTPPPCEVIDVSLFEEFAESLAASPMSVTLSVSSLDGCRGSDLNLSINFSEDDMEDLLVYPRVTASGVFTPMFSEEETTELDSDYHSRWSSSIKSSSVSGSVDTRGLSAMPKYGLQRNGGMRTMPLPLPLPSKVKGRVPAADLTTTIKAAPDSNGDLKKSSEDKRRAFHVDALERLGIRRSSPRFDMDAETSMVSSSDIDLHRPPSSGFSHRNVHNLSSDGSALSLGGGAGACSKDSDADMSSMEISPDVAAQSASVFEAFGQMYLLRPRRYLPSGRLSSRARRQPTGGRC